MTKRLDISANQVLFTDALRVDVQDLSTEQDFNNQINHATIHNHFGSGVLLSSPSQNVLFDSSDLTAEQAALVAANNFDGIGISAHAQPSNSTLGNQLEIELTDSSVLGRLSVKVAIIGLSFDGSLQMDRLYFYTNEKQVTAKHYTRILSIFFNDFKGNNYCSRNLGGKIVIREAKSFQLSRDPIMVSQDVEPDIFWRDFKRYNLSTTLQQIIQTGIGAEYNADDLDINTTGISNKKLEAGDVSSHVGQKFLAKTNNIQKITLLLGVDLDEDAASDDSFDWSGDLIVSVYPLQTSVSCSTDIVPGLAIDFDPASEPLVQLSFNQNTLKDAGYILNNVLQPVDFVFSDSKIANPGQITVGNYYAVTVKRNGSTSIGNILVGVGANRSDDMRTTLFSGGVWVDIPEQDLWIQVWTDAVKYASGYGYDEGIGIQVSETTIDSSTGATIDNTNQHYSFNDSGFNAINVGVIQATVENLVEEQDERNGNSIWSRQKFVPTLSLISTSDLEDLQTTSSPFVIGGIKDVNPKLNPELEKIQEYPGMAKGNIFTVINPDADLLSLNLVGSILIPNDDAALKYKITKVTRCNRLYGDLNGDGVIDNDDVVLATSLIGEDINSTATQNKIVDGYIDDPLSLLAGDLDGYSDGITSNDVDLLTQFVAKQINGFAAGTYFTALKIEVESLTGRYDGYYSCSDGFVYIPDGYGGTQIVSTSSLSADELLYDGYNTEPQLELDPAYSVVPFVPLTYQIIPQKVWYPWQLLESSETRLVEAAFTYPEKNDIADCDSGTVSNCTTQFADAPSIDPGRNDYLIPGNLILNKGQIINLDGSYFKQDFEVATIELRLPIETFTESSINVFNVFCKDAGDGKTNKKYPALRYADCSTVQAEDLALNRLKFDVAIQSIYKAEVGTDPIFPDGYVIISNNTIGVHMDQVNGILTLNVQDLDLDPVYTTLITKLTITVYLKKAGWNNTHLIVAPTEAQGLVST